MFSIIAAWSAQGTMCAATIITIHDIAEWRLGRLAIAG